MNRRLILLASLAAAFVVAIVYFSFYTVSPTEQVIVLQFGAPQGIETEPGLHVKIPLVQTVAYIDKRLLSVEATAEDVTLQDQKSLSIDAFAMWRIADPVRFYRRSHTKGLAAQHLTTILISSIQDVLGAQTLSSVLSGQQDRIMRDVRSTMNQEAREFGIDVVDVRLRHADLPQQASAVILKRMQQERKREAAELTAEGAELSQRIRARAEREVTVIIAEANREADILRGEGDAEKTHILGDAYGQDPDFFDFYKSMKAYEDALPANDTTIVLSSNNEFFRYFLQGGNSAARARKR